MPPIRKYCREDIIKTTYELVQKEGLGCVNARRIAKQLGCSVQPIFHNFTTMEELIKEVHHRIYEKYKEYLLSGRDQPNAYKKIGLSYIQFAFDYPEFFKILFMKETTLDAEDFLMADVLGDHIIKSGQTLTGLSYEEQKKFHIKVWIFTHGIACLVATRTIQFSKEEIDELLGRTVLEMLEGYKKLMEEENEICS